MIKSTDAVAFAVVNCDMIKSYCGEGFANGWVTSIYMIYRLLCFSNEYPSDLEFCAVLKDVTIWFFIVGFALSSGPNAMAALSFNEPSMFSHVIALPDVVVSPVNIYELTPVLNFSLATVVAKGCRESISPVMATMVSVVGET